MNKSIKQIADELGIEKQKVYRFIKKNCINEVLQNGSMKYYDDTAQSLIKSHFREKEVHHDALQNHITDALLEQLKVKDIQIAELQKALNQAQQLQAIAEQKIHLLEDKEQIDIVQKKHWWLKK